ncbi:MAG: hypothetical protein E4H27_05490 [Anaerolineales bacterium]|nr:MAG: hypothetical protein E4H27_05490 [Anaerolineales bacterium]
MNDLIRLAAITAETDIWVPLFPEELTQRTESEEGWYRFLKRLELQGQTTQALSECVDNHIRDLSKESVGLRLSVRMAINAAIENVNGWNTFLTKYINKLRDEIDKINS